MEKIKICTCCDCELPLHMFRELPVNIEGNISLLIQQKHDEATRSDKCLDCSEVEETALWNEFYKTGERPK